MSWNTTEKKLSKKEEVLFFIVGIGFGPPRPTKPVAVSSRGKMLSEGKGGE